jgi:quinol-cytochrome oxidoreductase complex cytochrome b subunit
MTDVPEHLRKRAEDARRAVQEGNGQTGTGGGVATATLTAERDERLLEVIRQGSIQELRAQPTDKVNVWPHLLIIEFVAALTVLAFLTVFSIFVNAPFEELANPNKTPNPEKAPWYFLGLQEMLTYFDPMVSGVMLPGIAIVGLVLTPYIDRNPSHRPEDRKFAISVFTMFVMFWAVLVLIGSFFRGPGFTFVLPWKDGIFFTL